MRLCVLSPMGASNIHRGSKATTRRQALDRKMTTQATLGRLSRPLHRYRSSSSFIVVIFHATPNPSRLSAIPQPPRPTNPHNKRQLPSLSFRYPRQSTFNHAPLWRLALAILHAASRLHATTSHPREHSRHSQHNFQNVHYINRGNSICFFNFRTYADGKVQNFLDFYKALTII